MEQGGSGSRLLQDGFHYSLQHWYSTDTVLYSARFLLSLMQIHIQIQRHNRRDLMTDIQGCIGGYTRVYAGILTSLVIIKQGIRYKFYTRRLLMPWNMPRMRWRPGLHLGPRWRTPLPKNPTSSALDARRLVSSIYPPIFLAIHHCRYTICTVHGNKKSDGYLWTE